MSLEQEFLNTFKTLEVELISLARLNDDYVSFSRALNKVYTNRLNPIVSDADVYEFLKTASDLRNILSHRNNVCVPSEEFLKKIKKITDEIIHPAKCEDIATKENDLVLCHPGNKILDVIDAMSKKSLSNIPVIYDGKIIGVFSRTTFFDYYVKNRKLCVDEEFTVRDFMDYVDIDSHTNERYLFVKPNTSLYDVYKELTLRKEPKKKRLSCIFVTSNGKNNGKLIGVITEADMIKIPYKI